MASSQSIEVFKGLLVNLQAQGAVPDCAVITDAAITATDKTLTSATGPFSANSVGMVVCVNGAGTAGAALVTAIASFTSTSSVELTAAAATTVSGAVAVFGTDNKTAFSSFRTTCQSAGRQYWIPSGWYLTTETVDFADGSIEIQGEARDNVASSVIVYVGTGVGVYIHPTDLGTQCFAANIKNVAIATYGGASDALKLRNLSQAILENVGVGQANGAVAATGMNLINPNLITFRNPIVQGCTNAVVIDSTGFPWDATGVTFSGGNLYQNTTVFDFRANTVHVTIQHVHIEQYATCFKFDKANPNLQIERLVIEDNEILGGGGTFTDATLISGAAPGITTLLARRIEFSRNRCYFIVAKENPINFNITGTGDIQLRLTDNVFSNITTSLISANSTGVEVIAEGNLTRFGSAFTLLSAGSTASLLVPIYGGQRITGAGFIPYSRAAGELTASAKLLFANDKVTISTDPADAQLELSDSVYSRVLRWFVGTTGYTAVLKFAGALGALAIKGLTTLGSDEPPPCTVFIHNADVSGHTQLQVKGNAADGSVNAIVNILTAASAAGFQIFGDGKVYFPLLTVSKPMRLGAAGEATSGSIGLDTDDVSSSMAVGSLVSVDTGGKLKAASAFATGRILGTNDSTGAVEVKDVDLGNTAHVTVPGSTGDLLYNAGGLVGPIAFADFEATLKSYFDTLYAPLVHNHAEGDITNLLTDLGALDSAITGLGSGKADHGSYAVTGGGGGTVDI